MLVERRIQNPVKHLRWSVLQKWLTSFSRQLFLQNAPFQMFDRVLKTFLLSTVKFGSSRAFGIRNKVINASNMLLKKSDCCYCSIHRDRDIKTNDFLVCFKVIFKKQNSFQNSKGAVTCRRGEIQPGLKFHPGSKFFQIT